MTEESRIPLIDDPRAPEVFAANATGFLNIGNSIVITLETGKSDYSGDQPTISRHVVARLIMPVDGARGLAVGLFDYLRKQGFEDGPEKDGGPSLQ